VAAIDHTYEVSTLAFPDGRVVPFFAKIFQPVLPVVVQNFQTRGDA
jgi:hypothetical protein